MAIFPLFALMTALLVPHHQAPLHHPHLRPHHLHPMGPGAKVQPNHRAQPAPTPAPAATAAPTAAAAADDDVEEIESVTPVTEVTPGAAPSVTGAGTDGPLPPGAQEDHVLGVIPNASAPLGSLPWVAGALGHLHAALVHLPIAWVLLWALVEVMSVISDHKALSPSALFLAVLSLVSFAPAALSGLCRLDELASTTRGYDTAEAILHRNLIFVAAGLCGGCLVLRLIIWRWPNMFCRLLCLMGVVVACAITSYSAHLGGRMVYGADFLPF